MSSMFSMPVRGGSKPAFQAGGASAGGGGSSQGMSFQFSLPTGGDAPSHRAAPKEESNSAQPKSSMFRPFTFSTPARGNDPTPCTSDDAVSMVDDGSVVDEDDGESQFDFDETPAAAESANENANINACAGSSFTMNFKPTQPSFNANKPPPSQGLNIQFNLPSMGGGANRQGGGGGGPNPGVVAARNDPSGNRSDMTDGDMPAGEDAFSHASGKTGHTTRDDQDDEPGKCSQESDTSHATSRSAESAYTCETRSMIGGSAPVVNSSSHAHGGDSASVIGESAAPQEKEVDSATLARLAEEHEQLTSNVRTAVDKFVTTQSTMRTKLLTAEQEFSSISENAGSLQVSLAQSLCDLLVMKLQLSIRKVANHKLVCKLQESLTDSNKTGEGLTMEPNAPAVVQASA